MQLDVSEQARVINPRTHGVDYELERIVIRLVNGASNMLADDSFGRIARRLVLGWLGVRLGRRSTIEGGGYINGRKLVIGRGCYVNRGGYFDLVATVRFGDNVVVGQRVTFITAVHHIGPSARRAGSVDGLPIHIGDGAWIGANATILPGVTIGAGSIVAAGAVVARDVPPDTLVGGVPARPIRELEQASISGV